MQKLPKMCCIIPCEARASHLTVFEDKGVPIPISGFCEKHELKHRDSIGHEYKIVSVEEVIALLNVGELS